MIRVALILIACAMSGCASRQTPRGIIHDPLARFADGGEIYARWEYTGDPPCTDGPVVVWQMPGHEPKQLITIMPTTGSPTSPADRLFNEPLANTKRHDVGEGKRVWLESNGRAVASFDYGAGITVIGPYAQPTWARPDARPLPGE